MNNGCDMQFCTAYVEDVALRLGRASAALKVFDMETSHRIRATIVTAQKPWRNCTGPGFSQSWPISESQEVQTVLDRLAASITDTRVFLFRRHSDRCGAIETHAHELLAHALDLVDIEAEDDVIATADDLVNGIVVMANFEQLLIDYGSERITAYTVMVWGAQWGNALTSLPST